MGTRPPLVIAILAVALGCTTVMYPGPRRPAREVAGLVNDETAIDMLDGQAFAHLHSQRGARYEILPGRHALGVSIFIVTILPGGIADIEKSDTTVTVCLNAQAGHTYVIGHEDRGGNWRPIILDYDTHAPVPVVACSKPPLETVPGPPHS